MSTIPKEIEEKMKHAIKAYYSVGNQVHENLAYNIMQYGYQLATDGREVENVTVEYWQKLYGEAHQLLFDANTKITALQSSLKEKEAEITLLDEREVIWAAKKEQLEEALSEKENECEDWKERHRLLDEENNYFDKIFNEKEKQIEELKAENERLKGIINENKKFFDNLWDEKPEK